MSSSVRVILIVLAIVGVGLSGSYAVSLWADGATDWLPVGISVASIAIAILATFKADLFDFEPRLLGGDFALIHSSEPNPTNSGVLLPVHFINTGYGEGAILSIAVEATHVERGEKYLLIPIAEINLQKLLQRTGRMHASNIEGPFLGFPLASKQAVSKSIAFTWVGDNPAYAKPYLGPGTYRFEVFVETDRSRKPRCLLKLEHKFDQRQIDSFASGNAVYNMRASPLLTAPHKAP